MPETTKDKEGQQGQQALGALPSEVSGTKCMACGASDDKVKPVVGEALARMSDAYKAFYGGFGSIQMHGECLDELANAIPSEDARREMEALAENALAIARSGTYAERINLIRKVPEAVKQGAGMRSVGWALSQSGSEDVIMELIGMGSDALEIGEGTVYSVACNVVELHGSEKVYLAIIEKAPGSLKIVDPVNDETMAHHLAASGYESVQLALIGKGIDMLRIGNGAEWSVAYELAKLGSGEVCRKLIDAGLPALMIGHGTGFSVAKMLEERGYIKARDVAMEALKAAAKAMEETTGLLRGQTAA